MHGGGSNRNKDLESLTQTFQHISMMTEGGGGLKARNEQKRMEEKGIKKKGTKKKGMMKKGMTKKGMKKRG